MSVLGGNLVGKVLCRVGGRELVLTADRLFEVLIMSRMRLVTGFMTCRYVGRAVLSYLDWSYVVFLVVVVGKASVGLS